MLRSSYLFSHGYFSHWYYFIIREHEAFLSISYLDQPFSAIFLKWDRKLENISIISLSLPHGRHAGGAFLLFSSARPFDRE